MIGRGKRYAAVHAFACVAFLAACGSSDDDSSAGTKAGSSKDSGVKPHSTASTTHPDAAIEADASASDAAGSSTCDARDCWCEMSCANIASVACPDDQPQSDCEKQCKMPMGTDCADEDLALVKCQATRPTSAFSCDLDQHIYTVKGCENQQDAVTNCLFSM